MSLKRKLEGEVEIRAGAGDVFHELCKSTPHHIPNVVPHFIQACDLHEGQLGQTDSTLIWNYNIGGKAFIAKNKIEEIDEEKKLVKQSCIEGDLLKEYKTISGTCQVIAKDNETSFVRWTLEYERLSPEIPEPTALLDSLLAAAKDIDDHHHGVKK